MISLDLCSWILQGKVDVEPCRIIDLLSTTAHAYDIKFGRGQNTESMAQYAYWMTNVDPVEIAFTKLNAVL